jgi:alpha-D-xyloside xylohydrolase
MRGIHVTRLLTAAIHAPTFSEMASVLRGGLSCAMSGIGLWGTDIGGFMASRRKISLHSLFSARNVVALRAVSRSRRARTLELRRETVDIYRKYADSVPTNSVSGFAERICPSRPAFPDAALVLDFQDDPNTAHLESQYLLGESLLVAPVLAKKTSGAFICPKANGWTSGRIAPNAARNGFLIRRPSTQCLCLSKQVR